MEGNDNDTEEEWMGYRLCGCLSWSLGGHGEYSLWLLRFRTSPKPCSDKDKRNPSEAQGGAADAKAPTAAPGICLLVCKDSTWQSLSMTEIAGQLCPVFGVKSPY